MSVLNFYSHGKLLLTGEYIVLDGARALAIPTKYGQSLAVEVINEPVLNWKSINNQGNTWFESSFLVKNKLINLFNDTNLDPISSRLLQILNAARELNPNFLVDHFSQNKGLMVTSKLDFPRNWGLGSSSTLLNNIAQWASIDAFKLSKATFGGSGYDIACAQNSTPIIYKLTQKEQLITPLAFNPSFKSQLFFVYLNQKKDSRDAIKTYEKNKSDVSSAIIEINEITETLIKTTALTTFEALLFKHETIIGNLTNQTPIKERLFSDYKYTVKSLGGWGGDFILVTGNENYVHSYFEEKGFTTIISYKEMVL